MTDVAVEVLRANISSLIKTKDGKAFIWELLTMCDIYSYNQAGDLWKEGRRSIGLDILSLIEESDPAFYGRLLIEKQESKDG